MRIENIEVMITGERLEQYRAHLNGAEKADLKAVAELLLEDIPSERALVWRTGDQEPAFAGDDEIQVDFPLTIELLMDARNLERGFISFSKHSVVAAEDVDTLEVLDVRSCLCITSCNAAGLLLVSFYLDKKTSDFYSDEEQDFLTKVASMYPGSAEG